MTDVCKQSNDSISTVLNGTKRISNLAVGNIRKLKNKATETGQQAINTVYNKVDVVKKKQRGVLGWATHKIGKFYGYFNGPTRRPDLVFFRNIILLVVALFVVYYVLPKVTSRVSTKFNKQQFEKATKLPESAFNIEEIAKVNQEVKAFQDHKEFFDDGGAFAPENAGAYEMGKTSVALPMLIFFLQFVLPPIAIGYIIWFIITYWSDVYNALWGWFLAMYDYFTTLVQGRLGCKWYIRWVTGWGCRTPNFGDYVRRWRQRYIDGPVVREQIKYIQKYKAAKERYVTKPIEKYITKPVKYYGVKRDYALTVATDRTVEVILKKARDRYKPTGPLGPSNIMGRLYGNLVNRTGISLSRTRKEAEATLNGFESTTVTGDSCSCPGAVGNARSLVEKGKNVISNIQRDMPEFSTGQKQGRRACEIADQTIKDRAAIMGMSIVSILALLIVIYVISFKYGTPVFIKNIISNVNIRTSLTPMVHKRWPYLPYIIIATTIGILAHTGFA